jgi:6-phosphofructokinase 1
MRVGILTGGGDVPGLNACIKALVNRICDAGHAAVGIRRGWRGLLDLDPASPETVAELTVPLDRLAVRTVDRSGGTFLHTSRLDPSKVFPAQVPVFLRPAGLLDDGAPIDFTAHVLANLDALGIDVLVPLGGEGTLSYAARIHAEGFPVVCIPKTMDNDVFGTDYCIGFSTAITRSVNFVHQLRSSFGSHERIGVVELFGRRSGHTSLVTAHLCGADRAVIAEVPFDITRLADLLLKDKMDNPSGYAVLVVSEGAREIGGKPYQTSPTDPYGHLKLGGIGPLIAEKLEIILGWRTMSQRLAYLMRSGAPDALDTMVAVNYANLAAGLALSRTTGRMVAMSDGRYTHVAADTALRGVKTVDVDALYDRVEYRPKVHSVLGKPMFLY